MIQRSRSLPHNLSVKDGQHYLYLFYIFPLHLEGVVTQDGQIGKLPGSDSSFDRIVKGGVGGFYGVHLQRLHRRDPLPWCKELSRFYLSGYGGIDAH